MSYEHKVALNPALPNYYTSKHMDHELYPQLVLQFYFPSPFHLASNFNITLIPVALYKL